MTFYSMILYESRVNTVQIVSFLPQSLNNKETLTTKKPGKSAITKLFFLRYDISLPLCLCRRFST